MTHAIALKMLPLELAVILRSPPTGEVWGMAFAPVLRMTKIAAEVCPSERGASSPKFRTACLIVSAVQSIMLTQHLWEAL